MKSRAQTNHNHLVTKLLYRLLHQSGLRCRITIQAWQYGYSPFTNTPVTALCLRFNGIAPPDFDDMQMTSTIQVNIVEAIIGSPYLDPYNADQYDLGLEWYFTDASVAGVTLFQKNISDYVEQTTAIESLAGCSATCRVTRSRNVGLISAVLNCNTNTI